MFFKLGKKPFNAMGVDLSPDGLHMIQLANGRGDLRLVAKGYRQRPADIESRTAAWQHWVVDALRDLLAQEGFMGKSIQAAMAPEDVIIETVKKAKLKDPKFPGVILSRVGIRVSPECSQDNLVIKAIPIGSDHAMVMATDKELINRYLAMFERSGLEIKAISTWPEALHQSYLRFFGQTNADQRHAIMLLDILKDCTNVVICRHTQMLFARSLPIGSTGLEGETAINRLSLELSTCRTDFQGLYPDQVVSRVVFLSGNAVNASVYLTMAKQLEIQAQVGDCMAAVEGATTNGSVDRGSWATAFGLGLL